MSSEITVTEHLLLQQQRAPQATGHFTALFHDLVLSAKIIARSVNKAGLLDVLGGTGDINVQGENVQKLDDFANRVLLYRMERSGVLCAIASEENAELVRVSAAFPRGDYMLVFDPLDGSSNIDVNINVGTIFSILRRKPGRTGEVQLDEILQPGSEQVPETGSIYSVNEGNWNHWDDKARAAIDYFKHPDDPNATPCSARYVGSLVADFHRTLLYGGVYMYPPDSRKGKSRGKLRYLCEASPLAFVAENAGGAATDGHNRILDITPTTLHERVPLFIGSRKDVEAINAIYKK